MEILAVAKHPLKGQRADLWQACASTIILAQDLVGLLQVGGCFSDAIIVFLEVSRSGRDGCGSHPLSYLCSSIEVPNGTAEQLVLTFVLLGNIEVLRLDTVGFESKIVGLNSLSIIYCKGIVTTNPIVDPSESLHGSVLYVANVFYVPSSTNLS